MKPAERMPPEPPALASRRGRSRRLLAAGAAVALVAAAVAGWRLTRSAPGPRFETAKVDRGRIVAQVTATGTLSALVTVDRKSVV